MKTWQAWIILAIATYAAYANSFSVPFVFDDAHVVRDSSPTDIIPRPWQLSGRQLLRWSIAVNKAVSGYSVFSYHLVNLVVHLVNGFLIFAIARRLHSNDVWALLAAAFFLVHPIQVEAVTYISERSELLSKCCYLAGMLIFIRLAGRRMTMFSLMPIMLCLVLGLEFKESAITLPLMIGVYDWFILSKSIRERLTFYVGMAIVAAIGFNVFLVVLVRGIFRSGWPGWNQTMEPLAYLLTSVRVLIQYVGLVLWPVGLNLDHDIRPSMGIGDPAVLGSVVAIVALLWLAWGYRKDRPIYSLAIVWFFVAILPTTSLLPIPDPMGEHRLYLSMAGVCLCFPVLIDDAVRWSSARFRLRQKRG